MRILVLAAVAAIAFTAPASAQPNSFSKDACATTWNSMSAADKAKTTYGDYVKTCTASGPTAAPPANTVPKPAEGMNQAEKKQACESRWLAQKKVTPTGSQTHDDFVNACLKSQ
ncbi:MAG TPA: hypothetical protein VGM36_02500 [Rhizomicrobium sp.]